jgi:hypothetical protein
LELLKKDSKCEYLSACTLIGLYEGLGINAKETQQALKGTCRQCRGKTPRKKARKKAMANA